MQFQISDFYKKLGDSGELEVSDFIAYGGDYERRKIEEPVGVDNLKRFFYLVVAVIIAITARTAYLQITKGAYYASRADRNRINNIVVKAPRGVIADRNNIPLVNNAASFDLVVIPARLPQDPDEKERVLSNCLSLAELEGRDVPSLSALKELPRDSLLPFLIKENLPHEEAVSFEVHKSACPGFETEKTAIREYLDPVIFSHILGYTGKVREEDLKKDPDYLMTDNVGRSGIEEFYERELKGVHGSIQVEVNSSGRVLRELEEISPRPGDRLVLSVDKGVQVKLYEALQEMIKEKEATKAAAVAMDPRDGSIIGLVSIPGYDNNLFSRGIKGDEYKGLLEDPNKPLLNRAVSGIYPPGSTLKPLVAIAALEEGIVTPETTVDCHGAISIGSWRFGDWKTHGAGVDLNKAIAESCDVYFYTVGGGYGEFAGLGMDRMKKYEEVFGLNDITGIDLPNEKKGFIPTPDWKERWKKERWYIGDSYHASIGQGDISVTPIQIANYISAIANGGILHTPHLVKEFRDEFSGEVVQAVESKPLKTEVADSKALSDLRTAMRETVLTGSARSLNELGIDACGKTGTAQVGGTDKTQAWFTGFAPYDNPEIVITVLIEEGGEGSEAAVPVAKEVLKYYFENKK